jgi:hypothetical protein
MKTFRPNLIGKIDAQDKSYDFCIADVVVAICSVVIRVEENKSYLTNAFSHFLQFFAKSQHWPLGCIVELLTFSLADKFGFTKPFEERPANVKPGIRIVNGQSLRVLVRVHKNEPVSKSRAGSGLKNAGSGWAWALYCGLGLLRAWPGLGVWTAGLAQKPADPALNKSF